MPSVAPSCRHAARSVHKSAIWITDDILDNAFDRFQRVSRTTKRYGSNVPGPMEAQRRLAKRRMVGLADVGSPSAFDIGVLFYSGPPRQDELNWQPPAPPDKLRTATTTTLSQPTMNSAFTRFLNQFRVDTEQNKDPQALLKTQLETLRSLKWAQMLAHGARMSGMGPVQYSQLAFEALLANKAPLRDLLGFLKDPTLNLPQVRNASILVTHYHGQGRPVPTDFEGLLPQLLSLGMVEPTELLHILRTLPAISQASIQRIWEGMKACRVTPVWTDCARRLLSRTIALIEDGAWKRPLDGLRLELYQHAFPMGHHSISEAPDVGHHLAHWVSSLHAPLKNAADCPDRNTVLHVIALLCKKKQILLSATMRLLHQKPSIDDDIPSWKSLINDWLAMLLEGTETSSWILKPALQLRGDPRQLDSFYNLISEHLTPRDLAPHFKNFPTFTTSCIIAQSWVPRLCAGSWSATNRKDFECYLRLLPTTDLRPRTFVRRTDHFADLVIALARRGHDYEPCMTAIVELCHTIYGTQGVFDLVRTWRYAQIRVIPEVFGGLLQSLSQTEPWTALALYQQARLWIGSSPELLPKLIERGMSAYKIFQLLNHKDPTNSVPVHLRQNPKNNLHHTRNTLIHVVADALSRSQGVRRLSGPKTMRSLRSRQIFRNVYLAYRYLVARQSPVRPLMSRALVRAGIIRPLENNEWVSTSRIRWILHIVGRVEGEAVANELDEKIYVWRGRVHRFIMSRGAYMRSKDTYMRQQHDARERLRKRALEIRALRNRRGVALIVSDRLHEGLEELREVEGDALSSLEENLSPTSMDLSRQKQMGSHDDRLSLSLPTQVNATLKLEKIDPHALSESFEISPQFQDLQGVQDIVQSSLTIPVRPRREYSPHRSSSVGRPVHTGSTEPIHYGGSRTPPMPLPHSNSENTTSSPTANPPSRLPRRLHRPAFSIGAERGSIRDDRTQFSTIKSSLIRYHVTDNGDEARHTRPLKPRMTAKGESALGSRYRRVEGVGFVKVY